MGHCILASAVHALLGMHLPCSKNMDDNEQICNGHEPPRVDKPAHSHQLSGTCKYNCNEQSFLSSTQGGAPKAGEQVRRYKFVAKSCIANAANASCQAVLSEGACAACSMQQAQVHSPLKKQVTPKPSTAAHLHSTPCGMTCCKHCQSDALQRWRAWLHNALWVGLLCAALLPACPG